MCGRFAMTKETDELITEFVAQGGDFRDWRPFYNIAPAQTIPVLLESARGSADVVRRLEPARWSLLISTARRPRYGASPRMTPGSSVGSGLRVGTRYD
ncbi:SOS response-associated peptidase family protein [Lacisediminihabitans sp. H27-G8]|uniref:SOS response-associated peptidase family protein n=1 Tax=Lacisediminihabitans sp. H27-G8 TaxID=3111909 RepID=UPI0038FC38FA